jgi:hypothetical protein
VNAFSFPPPPPSPEPDALRLEGRDFLRTELADGKPVRIASRRRKPNPGPAWTRTSAARWASAAGSA